MSLPMAPMSYLPIILFILWHLFITEDAAIDLVSAWNNHSPDIFMAARIYSS